MRYISLGVLTEKQAEKKLRRWRMNNYDNDYKVDSQILRRTSRNLIVADSIKYLAVRFDFSDEWRRH